MKNYSKSLIYAIALMLIFSSCKAYRNVENLKPKSSKEVKEGPFNRNSISNLVPGEQIIVSTLSNFTYHMIYKSYDGMNLVGEVQKVNKNKVIKAEVMKIPIKEIETLKVRRVSPAATTVAATIGAGALFFIGLFLALALGEFDVI